MDEMRVMGRNTQGVRLINLKKNDEIAAIAKVAMDKEVEEDSEENEEGVETVANNQQNNSVPENGNENLIEETENSDSEE
jgi:DNA gyrase C-terminal domain, beta-propeller.